MQISDDPWYSCGNLLPHPTAAPKSCCEILFAVEVARSCCYRSFFWISDGACLQHLSDIPLLFTFSLFFFLHGTELWKISLKTLWQRFQCKNHCKISWSRFASHCFLLPQEHHAKAPHTYISCTLQLHSHGQHMIEHLAIYQFLTLKYSEAIRTLLQPSCICNLIKMQS